MEQGPITIAFYTKDERLPQDPMASEGLSRDQTRAGWTRNLSSLLLQETRDLMDNLRKDTAWWLQCAKCKTEDRNEDCALKGSRAESPVSGEEWSQRGQRERRGGRGRQERGKVSSESPRDPARGESVSWLCSGKRHPRSLHTEQTANESRIGLSELKLFQELSLIYKRWGLETSRRAKRLAQRDSFWVIFFGWWYFVADPNSPSSAPNNSKKRTKFRSDMEPGQPECSMKKLFP